MNAAEVLGTTNWRIVLIAGARKRNEKVLKRMAKDFHGFNYYVMVF
jgi:hypothetical protein